ncbi:type III-B CRISPR-associated protein Cas10/Cmr2 [Halothiobacillus diazotrophicus]|uniref:Type III-B CRISPR-associated protein Cas10/Cmr2 n=1 Tax=Halothiobacillus diazotrophicus TaxID=1860122 RepID=A0A191ZFL8_9GAMM|nr:type III-B CRISPR-associated protein Cas10/Cmr2 [Halothiobacillus diazotrophicus]ANJ66663.1 type III-B CRISPR-associated protein Cas10/Cmr2 [Halothiobacillus diazotrophicus]
MSTSHYFHFTLGPVQGFVAQARRTRDFWAGSFILSWLSAVAIEAVGRQGGDVAFPEPDGHYMNWLVGKGSGRQPRQGSIPNRFKGVVAAVDPATFDPDVVVGAVQAAWQALADTVWTHDLSEVAGPVQRAVWDRQIGRFWDMSWVITPDEGDGAALDKRKNWRTHTPPDEPGVKCSMMEGWQELSGQVAPNRREMNAFWDAVREQGQNGMTSDLAENEALCAIAFVKRRFSRHFHHLDAQLPSGWKLKGWEVPSGVPSVAYMAAVPWLKNVLEKADADDLRAFHAAAAELTGGEYGEWLTTIRCLRAQPRAGDFKHLLSLDGNVFYSSQLENRNLFPDRALAEKAQKALKRVEVSAGLDPVSPFYAILLMDGDSLGSHMSDIGKQRAIADGLRKFTRQAPDIVDRWNGFLIYAGGDDVLAVLPLEDAIPCATELRSHYLGCFRDTGIPTTLSGGIEFAHIRMPLGKVLGDAHPLLDELAKDGRGRDALAIRVWKPGGSKIEWAQPWSIALNPESNKTYLEEIAGQLRLEGEESTQFSGKFIYKIVERLADLAPTEGGDDDARSVLTDVLAMEYLNSGKSRLTTRGEARQFIQPLLEQCTPVIRDPDEPKPERWGRMVREADAALLVRFLAHKGVA